MPLGEPMGQYVTVGDVEAAAAFIGKEATKESELNSVVAAIKINQMRLALALKNKSLTDIPLIPNPQ